MILQRVVPVLKHVLALSQLIHSCDQKDLVATIPGHMTFHGGGGALLSAGLLEALDVNAFAACVRALRWKQGASLRSFHCSACYACLQFCQVPMGMIHESAILQI